MKIHFLVKYLLVTLFLFIAEVAIAYFHFSPFIRGFVGDVLIVLLLYSFLKIFIKNNTYTIATSVLAFAFLVELLQLFKLTEKFNIQSEVLQTILGSVFDPWDFTAYFLGYLIILLIHKFLIK